MRLDWETKPLADLCEIKPAKGEVRRLLKNSDLVSFVPMEDLGVDQKFLEPKAERKLGQVAGSYTYFADGDVLLAKITPCFENGKLGIAKNLTNGTGFGSSEYIVFRPNGQLSNEYLYYFLLQDRFRAEGIKTMSGAVGHKRISKDFIERCLIPLPSLSEQQRIVAVLDEAFAGLATATANAEKNLDNARELFDSYLKSIFSQKGDGWVYKSLDEVAIEFGRGKSKHRPRNDPALYGGKYPFIQTGDIRNAHHVIIEYSQTYNEKGLAQSKLWPKGTICITIAANIAETGILGFDACFPDSVIGMVVDSSRTNNKFVEYLLRFFKGVLQAQGKGSAQDNINLATFENRKFPFPPIEIQNELVDKLDAMAKHASRLEAHYQAKLQFMAELKQSILRKAFSGELISPPSIALEEAAE